MLVCQRVPLETKVVRKKHHPPLIRKSQLTRPINTNTPPMLKLIPIPIQIRIRAISPIAIVARPAIFHRVPAKDPVDAFQLAVNFVLEVDFEGLGRDANVGAVVGCVFVAAVCWACAAGELGGIPGAVFAGVEGCFPGCGEGGEEEGGCEEEGRGEVHDGGGVVELDGD
jgi:hypothetical protein